MNILLCVVLLFPIYRWCIVAEGLFGLYCVLCFYWLGRNGLQQLFSSSSPPLYIGKRLLLLMLLLLLFSLLFRLTETSIIYLKHISILHIFECVLFVYLILILRMCISIFVRSSYAWTEGCPGAKTDFARHTVQV